MHVTDTFVPAVGGLERAVNGLAHGWIARGHVAAVVTAAHPQAPPQEVTAGGVEVYRLRLTTQRLPGAYEDPNRTFFPPVPDPEFVRAFSELLDEWQPSVVHVHGWAVTSIAKAVENRDIPLISTAHDYGQACSVKTMLLPDGTTCDGPTLRGCVACARTHYGLKGVPLALGQRYVAGPRTTRVDAAIAISSSVAQAGSAPRARDRRPMRVISSFVHDRVLDLGASAPVPQWFPHHGRTVFFAGRLEPHKGVDTLRDALMLLRAQHPDVQLVLAGPRAPEASMGLNVPGIQVVVNPPHDEIMGAWRAADLGVVPSRAEAFGQAAVECLAAGTPLVVSAVGGLLDIVEGGVYGEAFRVGDPRHLAQALGDLLDAPARRQALSVTGPGRAREFTLSAVQPRIESVYRELLHARHCAPRSN